MIIEKGFINPYNCGVYFNNKDDDFKKCYYLNAIQHQRDMLFPQNLRLSIIIPVYNEEKTILEILYRISDIEINKQVIIIDDCSTDKSYEKVKDYIIKNDDSKRKNSVADNEFKILRLEKNRGKGAAIRTGLKHVNGDIVIIQDADLEYNPNEYIRLIQPILENKADVVYGSRFLGETHRVLFFWHYLGNKILTSLSNIFTNLNLSDMETCYKVFKANVIKDISLKSNRFGFEIEITVKLARKKCRFFEVAISYDGRDYSEGKKITWKDGIAAFYHIIRFGLFN